MPPKSKGVFFALLKNMPLRKRHPMGETHLLLEGWSQKAFGLKFDNAPDNEAHFLPLYISDCVEMTTEKAKDSLLLIKLGRTHRPFAWKCPCSFSC